MGELSLEPPDGPLHFTLVLAEILLELPLYSSVVLAHLGVDAPLRFAFGTLLGHTQFLCE
jgi:hypothetical protein